MDATERLGMWIGLAFALAAALCLLGMVTWDAIDEYRRKRRTAEASRVAKLQGLDL